VVAGDTPVLVHNTGPDEVCPIGAANSLIESGWRANTQLPVSGPVRRGPDGQPLPPVNRTVWEAGNGIWGNGRPSVDRLDGMTDDQLRDLATLEEATILNRLYADVANKSKGGQTASPRVVLSQKVIDAWKRATG